MSTDASSYDDDLASLSGLHIAEIEEKNEAYRRETLRENVGRAAVAEIQYTAVGTGQQRVSTAIAFPVSFRKEPHFTYGSAVASNPSPTVWNDPRGSAGVYAWKVSSRGHYVGAFIWVRVDADTIDGSDLLPPAFKTTIFLTFSAEAFKNVPITKLTSNLPARTVGI